MSLFPCPSCSRHVHTHESTCPFCYAPLSLAPASARPRTTARLGRAALLALGTSAAALGACGRDETPAQKTDEPPSPPKPTDIPAPVYGGPPPMAGDAGPPAPPTPPRVDAGAPTPKPLPTTGHTMAPAYGAPPPNLK